MPQTYGAINTGPGGDTVKAGSIALAARTDTLRSNFSGTSYPTGGVVGQHCYRTDLSAEYVLISTGPHVWSKVLTGTLAIADGGTGATTASGARTALGLGTAAVLNNGTASGELPTVSQSDARYTQKSNNLSDITSASTARTNLGLGALATLATVGAAQIDSGAINAAAKMADGVVTYAKIQVASAASKLIGSPSSGTTLQEISLGTGLSMSSGTLSATTSNTITKGVLATTDTSAGALTGLSFAIGASETWTAIFDIVATTAGSGTISFDFTGPSSPTTVLTNLMCVYGDSGSSSTSFNDHGTSLGTNLVAYVSASSGFKSCIRIMLTIINGVNAGTVQLNWALGTSAGTVSILRGSCMIAHKH